MEILEDTKVVTHNGEKVGNVDRVVLNPKTHQVTHVVVRKGVFLPKDKLVPLDAIDTAGGGGDVLRLKPGAPDPNSFSDYEETEYVRLDPTEQARANYDNEMVPPVYSYPAYGIAPVWGGSGFFGPYTGEFPGGYAPEQEANIPEGTVPLTEGTDVISADGHNVGSLDQVGMDSKTGRATHFVVARGLLLKSEKVLPVDWINYVDEDGIHLTVGAEFVKDLPNKED